MRLATNRRRLLALAAALSTAALGACAEGDDLITEAPDVAQGPLFARYVALGNSITAGFQSGGIVDSLQARSFAVLLAQRAGAEFYRPSLGGPGCPQPFLGPLQPAPAPPAGSPCFRVDSSPFVSNLAVPGARIRDLLTVPLSSITPLYTLITGGRPQADVMVELQPSFVSLWAGNNDALAAAVGGRLGPAAAGADSTLTPLASFQTSLNQLVQKIHDSGADGAVLIGVVDAVTAAPIVQPGLFFFLARDPATRRFQGKLVNDNCGPLNNLGQPNPLARNFFSFQGVGDANLTEINCDPATAPLGGAYLLDAAEITVVRTRVAQYNAALQAAATANGWAYVDPNTVLAPFLAEKTSAGRYNRVRKCQDLATATTQAQFQAAVANSCPVPPALGGAPNLFGSLISFDGVHPSTEAHRIIAGAVAARINAVYGTTLSTSQT